MNGVLHDVRYALRMMRKAPVVSGVAAVSLAVAIAANTTIFSVYDAFLLTPFPWEEPDRLVLLWQNNRNDPGDRPVQGADLLEWRSGLDSFEGIAAWTGGSVNLTGGDEPVQLREARTTPNTFDLLGGGMAVGRGFRPEEAGDPVVILDAELWETRFGSDPAVVGRTLQVNGQPLTVVGVLERDFDLFPANMDLYRPLDLSAFRSERRRTLGVTVARLADGVSRERARQELETLARRQEERFPETNEGIGVAVESLADTFPGPTDTRLLWVLLTVTGFLLLIACANVANLMLARAEARQREIGVRAALGSGRGRIVRQLLTESLTLAAGAALLGAPLGVWGVNISRSAMPPEVPAAFVPELDGSVLLFTILITAAAGLIFGLAPALHGVSGDLREALTAGSRGGTAGRRRRRIRNGFVMAEMALSLGLLVGAGMLMSVMDDFMNRDSGFDDRNLLTFRVTLPEERYGDDAALARFYRETARSIEAVSGVEAAALMSLLPRSRSATWNTRFTLDGRPDPGRNREPRALRLEVGAGWFDDMGVSLLRGRGLEESDRADAAPVVVVNREFARRHFPDDEAPGHRITLDGRSREIVGVADNVLHTRMIPEAGASAVIYVPMAQAAIRTVDVAVRARGSDAAALAGPVRRAMADVDPELPLAAMETYRSHLEQELAGPLTVGRLLGVFGTVALLLAAVGIYGVIAHSVTQRTREIGIRMALGAGAGRVVRGVTAQGLRLAGLGLLLGIPLAWALGKAVSGALVGVAAPGAGLVAAIVGTLVAVAVLASWLPARRAAAVEPVTALKEE